MQTKRKTLIITTVIIMLLIFGFIIVERGTDLFKGLDLYIFILIVVFGIIAMIRAIKKDKEEQLGLPTEDELSNKIKYKSGYMAYLGSMYMWLFIFIFNDKFPDNETMIGGGILPSAFIGFIAKVIVKRGIYEEQN